MPINVIFDMETQDPDDSQTLCRLLDHPQVNLKAVTLLPGSPHQVGLVRAILSRFHKDIPVGARNIEHSDPAVTRWHYQAYGDHPPSRAAEPAAELLVCLCDENTTLITGAPLTNPAEAIELANSKFKVRRLVAMGGFAGEGVVPSEDQLEEFRAKPTSREFNFEQDPNAVFLTLGHSGIGAKWLVSKNVTHGAIYDQDIHVRLAALRGKSLSLDLIWQGMAGYLDQYIPRKTKQLRKQGKLNATISGKKIHDLLAACCAIDPSIAEWVEVEIYQEENRWGARLCAGSKIWITTHFDQERFFRTLTAM